MGEAIGLGLDVGTSGLKGVAVAASGELVAEAEASYPLHTPRPGWSEQDPADWWAAARQVLEELAGRLGPGHETVALGLSGQMHGMVPLDRSGQVVRPAILWNDQRTADEVAQLERALPRSELIERTGNPAITGFQLAKVLWLRSHEREAFDRTRHVLFPKDYLGYRLTGELYAEPTDASGSNAFNLHARSWDGDVLSAVGLEPRLWPAVSQSRAVVGKLTAEAARKTGMPIGLNVVAGAGDNAAAAYGLGLDSSRPELGSVSLGTSGVILAPLREPRPEPQGRVHLFGHADGGYFLLAVTLAAAGSLRWFRDSVAGGRPYDELLAAAAETEPGSGGVHFKPYLSGERTPHMDPQLRGSFHGLSLATGPGHLVRAVLEGVAFSLRQGLEVTAPLCELERALLIGGGARSQLWSRVLCDVLQIPLGRVNAATGPAYGAARLALESAVEWKAPAADADADWLDPGDFVPYAAAYERYLDT